MKPKSVPEAASEALNRQNVQIAQYTSNGTASNATSNPSYTASNLQTSSQKIIEKPLPTEKTILPFTPEQLRNALKEQEIRQKPSQQTILEIPPRQSGAVYKDISHEIDAFENTLRDVHVINRQNVEMPKVKPESISHSDIDSLNTRSRKDGFFDEFEQFITRDDIQSDSLLDQDIVWKMKEFHKRRQEGKEYYIFSKDVQQAIERKLSHLKDLEHEWFILREKADEIERGLTGLEIEIQTRSQELKELMHQAKDKTRLERQVPSGKEFILKDGRRISTLLELKIALRNMNQDLFDHHVNSGRNDFAQWIRVVHNDQDLAALVQQVSSTGQLETLLAKVGR